MPYAIARPAETLKEFANYFSEHIATVQGQSEFLKALNHVRRMRESIARKEQKKLSSI